VKLRGKAFVYPGREKGSFALSTPMDEKELLMETEPDTFWETPHYRGWPAVLVRYGTPVARAHRNGHRARLVGPASKAQRTARGGERP
jgi:hypothetical protein